MMIENSPKEIESLINNNEKIIILDVREKWEYDICHIKNSLHIPMGQLVDRMSEFDKYDLYVIVCHHGIRSRMIGKYLSNIGFTNIVNLTNGIDGWADEIDNTMEKYV